MELKWYVLQVLTGRELAVRNVLLEERIPAKVPQEKCAIRRSGRWRYVVKTLFPSYVFVGFNDFNNTSYYQCMCIDGVIRFLGGSSPYTISDSESMQLYLLAPDNDPLAPSLITVEDGDILITSGILKQLKNNIIKIERRRRRAIVKVRFLGEEKTLTLSLLPTSEAGMDSVEK